MKVVLTDSNGIGLYNKLVNVFIDGTDLSGNTDNNGVLEFNITGKSFGTNYVTAAFLGEGNLYKGSLDTAKITVAKKATTLAAAKTKVSGKVKKAIKVKVTLKNGKNAIKGKKVTVKVNGKTFKATTNAKGVATLSVKVAKAGTFSAKVKFAGDSAYKASSSKTVKFTVKK